MRGLLAALLLVGTASAHPHFELEIATGSNAHMGCDVSASSGACTLANLYVGVTAPSLTPTTLAYAAPATLPLLNRTHECFLQPQL